MQTESGSSPETEIPMPPETQPATNGGAVQQTVEELRRQNEDYRQFFDLALDLICIAGTDGYFKKLNPAWERTLGFTTEELLARPFIEFIHPDDRADTMAEVGKMAHGSDAVRFENRYRHKDGSYRWLSWMAPSIRPGENHLCATAHDITERKRTETELQDREARMRAVLENAAEGIITIDQRGTIESANAMAERMFGYPLAEMMGRNVSMLMPAPYREEHDGYLANYIRTGNAKVIGGTREVAGRRKDGSEFPIELAVGEVHVEGRRLFTGFVRDITARKEAERQVARLGAETVERAAQLEAANKELEAFSYSVSHDLRAPLRHVHGYVALLKKALGDSLPEKAARHLEVIISASTQMGQLIDDLLAFSRIGRTEMHRGTVNLDELVQGCVASLAAETGGRNITWHIAALPAVAGDPAMLRKVFANLLDNAVKYTGPRNPAEIEIGTRGNEDGRTVFFVRDNGVGFDMQFADKLFGVFQRLHTSEEFEGTGIGLANVRRIITRHGGRVWPEAVLDRGATFFFTLEEAAPAWDAAAML